MLLFSVMAYTIATGATSLAPTMALFVGLQFFARLFLHAESAVVWTIAAEELPAEARGFGFGFLGMASTLGVGFGAILYGGLLQPMGVSWRFMYVAALPPLVLVAALRRRLPETRRFIAARDSGTLADRWHRIFKPEVRRALVLVLSTAFLFQLTAQATLFALDFLQTNRGLSARTASFLLVGAGIPGIPLMVKAGSLSDRFGRRIVGCGFGLLSVVGALCFFWLPGGVPVLLPSLTLVLVGQLGSFPVIVGYATELFPTALRGQASAWSGVAKVIGSATSLGLGGLFLKLAGLSFSATTTILLAGPVLAIVIVAVRFPDTHGRELEETSGDEHDLAGYLPVLEVVKDLGHVL